MIPENIIAIEFFSGIGGWAQALKLLNSSSSTTMDDNPIDHRVIKCFDCNEVANKSYEYNFKHISNVNPKNIEKLSEKDLLMIDNINKKKKKKRKTCDINIDNDIDCNDLKDSNIKINTWLMSPPCQPFTRSNTTSKRDDNDPRSDAIKHIIQILHESS